MPELYDKSILQSWSSWLPVGTASLIIWVAVFRRRLIAPGQIGVKHFLVAMALYHVLYFYHCCRIHNSQVDPTNDVWFLFAPVALMVRAPIVCGPILLAAVVARETAQFLSSRFQHQGPEPESHNP